MSKLDRFPLIERSVALSDLEVDGRTVTAYAATFDHEYPVVDFDGDYDELINRTAFNRHLSQHGIRNVTTLFNHGLTMWNTPSDRFSQPLGATLEMKPDSKGLLTVTRYNKTPFADEVLEMWRNGDVKAQSFRGPIIRSAPRRVVGGRTKIERLELGIVEYGPAPRVANVEAELVSLRSAMLLDEFTSLSDEERERLRLLLEGTPNGDSPSTPDTPVVDPSGSADTPGTGDEPPAEDPSVDPLILANDQRRRRDV